ncbi:hypothetical protein D9M72_530590 [compost metagenome]
MLEELVFHQRSQRGRGHVQQGDEEHGPGYGVARFLDRRRGVEPRQDVRQAGGADHQAEHQQDKIQPLGLAFLLRCRGIGLGR